MHLYCIVNADRVAKMLRCSDESVTPVVIESMTICSRRELNIHYCG